METLNLPSNTSSSSLPATSKLDYYNYYKLSLPLSNSQLMNINITNSVYAKFCGIIILGMGSLILGLSPIIIRKKKQQKTNISLNKLTSVLMYFGGGVLLATTFLHLLQEVKEQIEILQKENVLFSSKEYPYAECIMCFGFFMMFSIENIVHLFLSGTSQHEIKNINIKKTKNYNSTYNGSDADTVHVIDPNEPINETYNHHNDNHHHHHHDNHHNHHHDHSHDHSQLLRSGSIRNFLIVMALSIHEIFEGLAVGLEQISTQVWYLVMAVACHKFVIALCLGLQITNNTINIVSKKLFIINIIYVVIFAMCSPIGIAIGMIITLMSSSDPSSSTTLTILSVLLQGIATGTLLYIVFFEILKPHDHHTTKIQLILNLMFLILGFVLMAFIQFLTAD